MAAISILSGICKERICQKTSSDTSIGLYENNWHEMEVHVHDQEIEDKELSFQGPSLFGCKSSSGLWADAWIDCTAPLVLNQPSGFHFGPWDGHGLAIRGGNIIGNTLETFLDTRCFVVAMTVPRDIDHQVPVPFLTLIIGVDVVLFQTVCCHHNFYRFIVLVVD